MSANVSSAHSHSWLLINPHHACAIMVIVVDGLSVCFCGWVCLTADLEGRYGSKEARRWLFKVPFFLNFGLVL